MDYWLGTLLNMSTERSFHRTQIYSEEYFLLAINQPGTDIEKYKARFIVQGHTEKETQYTIHISKTVRHKNIKFLISIAVIYKLKVWNKDVNQAYIQAHDLERDVYVIPYPLFGLPIHIVLKLLNPLYGLTKWGLMVSQIYIIF